MFKLNPTFIHYFSYFSSNYRLWVHYTLFLLFLFKNIDCGYSLEEVLMSTHNLCFEQKYEKYQCFFYLEKNLFLDLKFSVYFI